MSTSCQTLSWLPSKREPRQTQCLLKELFASALTQESITTDAGLSVTSSHPAYTCVGGNLEAGEGAYLHMAGMVITSIITDGGRDGSQCCGKSLHRQTALARRRGCTLSHHLHMQAVRHSVLSSPLPLKPSAIDCVGTRARLGLWAYFG